MGTKGLLMTVKVTPADVTDRDAARTMLPKLRKSNPALTLMWADNGYTGLADWARNDLDLTFKVVKKPPNQVGFKVLPRLLWNLICQVCPAMTDQPSRRVELIADIRRGEIRIAPWTTRRSRP